jgi:Fur family peroxide stress response transcriptional regulator
LLTAITITIYKPGKEGNAVPVIKYRKICLIVNYTLNLLLKWNNSTLNMDTEQIKIKLRNNGLKATPKRISILEAIFGLGNHPTAEEIIKFIRNQKLDIATATVYKALEIFEEKKIIIKVETGTNIIRYDAIVEPHHHLYNTDSKMIRDYKNEQITKIIDNYFKKNKIKDFDIKEIKLHLIGEFRNNYK